MQNSQIEEKEDEDSKMKFDHFNSEINLLSIKILLEFFHRGEDVLTLGDFMKGDYWKEEEVYSVLYEYEDYSVTEDLVLAHIIHMVEDFGIGKVKLISVVGLDELLKSVVRKAIEEKKKNEDIDDLVGYYTWIMGEIFGLKRQSGEMQMKAIKKDIATWKYYMDRVDFKVSSAEEGYIYLKPLGISQIVHIAAPFMEIKVDYKNSKVDDVHRKLKDFLYAFTQDQYLDKLPFYRDKRYYYSKQLENFVEYINKLPLINGYVNVPFGALSEKGFEFVKVASYLEDQEKIKVTNWNDKDVWNIKFNQTPITVESLVSAGEIVKNMDNDDNLKINLSFDEANSILNVGEKIVKIRKMKDQYHLLRTIFEDKEEVGKEWFFSEIAEKYDSEADLDDKKFYNAAYQVSQKIARDAGIRDALITTTQSVRINPKYLS